MALAVDRFGLLFTELSENLASFQECLALIGSVYVARKALNAALHLCTAIRTYALPSIRGGNVDLCSAYGPWAG